MESGLSQYFHCDNKLFGGEAEWVAFAMKRKPTQASYQKLVAQMREHLLAAIKAHTSGKKAKLKVKPSGWTSAFLKVAWFGATNEDGWHSKFRLVLADGKLAGIQTSREVDDLTDQIGEVRAAVFRDTWYGFLLTVYPNGTHEVGLDHDPNCSADPHWYET